MKRLFILFLLTTPLTQISIAQFNDISAYRGWNRSTLTFDINTQDCQIPGQTLVAAVDRALAIWNNIPGSRIRLTRGAFTHLTAKKLYRDFNRKNARIREVPVIVCDSKFEKRMEKNNGSRTGAIGRVKIDTRGQVTWGYVALNTQQGHPGNIASVDDGKLSVLLAHEIGHVLGLRHLSDPNCVMYREISNFQELELCEEEVARLHQLYPRDGSLSEDHEEGDGSDFFGCGSTLMGANGTDLGNGPGTAVFPLFACLFFWLRLRRFRLSRC